jgi:hypothetical protein
MKGNYINTPAFRAQKTKPICRALAGNPKSEYLNPKQWNLTEPKLKKQSQFADEQINVTSYLKGSYGIFPLGGAQKTKPIQSQFPAFGRIWMLIRSSPRLRRYGLPATSGSPGR